MHGIEILLINGDKEKDGEGALSEGFM